MFFPLPKHLDEKEILEKINPALLEAAADRTDRECYELPLVDGPLPELPRALELRHALRLTS